MAGKLVYVRFDYNEPAAQNAFTCFIARRRVKNEDGSVNCVRGDSLSKHLDRVMSGAEWQEMSDALFETLRIRDWERTYKPKGGEVLDGYHWRLMLALDDRTKYEFVGDDEVPERWDELMDVFRPFFVELEALPEPEPEEPEIDPVTGEPYPDVSENVWSRFDDDGYGIHVVSRPGREKAHL